MTTKRFSIGKYCCPKCGKKFKRTDTSAEHAKKEGHYGDYNIYK